MAVFHGKAGKVTFAPTIVSVLSWTLSVISDVAESTVMHPTVWWKSFVAGFIDASATVEANAMTEAVIRVGNNANLKLYVNATKYFSMASAVCIGQTETVSLNEIGKVSYSFAADDIAGPTYN